MVQGATRSDNALPPRGVLLANFNQLYKIDPPTLDLWVSGAPTVGTGVGGTQRGERERERQ